MNTITAAVLLSSFAPASFGQEPAQQKSQPVYRIQLTLRESETGQQPNVRTYTMVTDEKDWAKLRTGGRIPYITSPGQFNYADVGTNITCRVFERGEQIKIDYEVELSSVSKVDPETRNPTMHQHRASGSSLVALNKGTVISTWEDPTSRRRYEVEVLPSRSLR